MSFENDKIKNSGAYTASIEKALLGDLQLRRAFSDYMATRNVLQEKGPVSMSDLATTALRFFKQHGRLDKVDKIGEDGSTAVKINVQVGGENEPWLLLIRTSNGISDCVKKAENERVKPYASIRLTVSGDPTRRKHPGTSLASSMDSAREYAEQTGRLGIATGVADELYHPVYETGSMESCAVIAAVPAVERVIGKVQSERAHERSALHEIGIENDTSGKQSEDAHVININYRATADWKKSPLCEESRSFSEGMRRLAADLNVCSKRGLSDRFDSTVGAGTVMMPLGGMNQLTPVQTAAHKIPTAHADTDDCSVAAWGFNPYIFDISPYHGAYLAVVESIAKLVASGASFNEVYLAIQQNFGAAADDAKKSGEQFAALLGAFEAEMGLGICSIGGDAVYDAARGAAGEAPSLISFALTTAKASELCSPEFKGCGHKVIMLKPDIDEDEQSAYYGLPNPKSLISLWRKAYELIANGKAVAAYTPGIGGIAEAVMKMTYGNGIGFDFDSWEAELSNEEVFGYCYGSIILEMANDDPVRSRSVDIVTLGYTTEKHIIKKADEALSIGELLVLYEGRLESVFPSNADSNIGLMQNAGYAARSWPTPIYKRAVPKMLIPSFAATTGAVDVAGAFRDVGGAAEILEFGGGVSGREAASEAERFAKALSGSQILCLASGMEGLSDEIVKLLEDEAARAALNEFLDKKDGLVLGLGAGFKSLLELGLLPGGTLSGNIIGSYQSRIAAVRVASNKSPWFRDNKAGEIFMIPVSTGAGRFAASEEMIKKLVVNGQIATQFVDTEGKASSDIRFNPGGSMMAIESISSFDGRVLGRIGSVDRIRKGLYRNVPGNYFSGMFENAMRYFR